MEREPIVGKEMVKSSSPKIIRLNQALINGKWLKDNYDMKLKTLKFTQ
ncbi:hypothetical protein C7972_101141 [Arenibacter sp. ARW7G5Y1]|nr:hypothetical protein C7972_101141 [Arenibacter sp. ARW7G5Y1]|tara:strand:+ start:17930 stop:18073 length:144 start_codon:yes stop_codon:yes gene_type:complete